MVWCAPLPPPSLLPCCRLEVLMHISGKGWVAAVQQEVGMQGEKTGEGMQ